ncbi:SDR family NAD(P)-dependent oxidoreductase [Amycolatopsis anabasis]|uniref:SDR family NAD(P)-dependent oxidoreductase n=1 Tax=Amycolatopsis anabasis TaxID=1840409 RepID=UPI00131DE111|nr:SDR family oxidoreductase [Amycolatopsis anabasis]
MLLENKNAVIYGGGGVIGGAVARAFALEGARIFLAGRTRAPLEAVAGEIGHTGGTADVALVDALDARAVDRHADEVAERAGGIDVSFNAIGIDNGEQAIPLVELPVEAYLIPVTTYARTHFLTAKAAARHMVERGSGVILPLSAPMARMPTALSGSFGIGFAAVECLARQLAAELGPHGVRVVCLRLDGIPESASLGSHTRQVWGRAAERLGIGLDRLLEMVGSGGVRGRPLTAAEVAEAAVLAATDRATALTGTVVNLTSGAVLD